MDRKLTELPIREYMNFISKIKIILSSVLTHIGKTIILVYLVEANIQSECRHTVSSYREFIAGNHKEKIFALINLSLDFCETSRNNDKVILKKLVVLHLLYT